MERATAVLEASRTLYAQSNIPPPPPHMGSDPISPLAMIAQMQGDYTRAAALGEEALSAAVLRGDPYNQSYAHYALTSVRAAQGDLQTAAHHAQQACELAQAVGNRWFSAIPRNEWGRAARAAGDLVQAKQHFRVSHEIMHEYHDQEGMAVALNELGEVAILEHDFAEADRLYREALDIYRGISDRVGRATALTGLARVADAQGDHIAAGNLYAQALDIATETEFLPLTLAIFVHAGNLLMTNGSLNAGVQAVVQAQQHPAVYYETKAQAFRLLECWRSDEDAERYRLAIQNAQDKDVDATVVMLEAELSAFVQSMET
jgi:tetratricopeptide (TPR) repeat protein